MYGYPGARGTLQNTVLAPANFRDQARTAIYQHLPESTQSLATSIRLAPSRLKQVQNLQKLRHSLALSVFSWSKRLVRLAPLLYSLSTATIPEDCEPTTTTVEQLINDILLHENFCREKVLERRGHAPQVLAFLGPESAPTGFLDDEYEEIKISLGSELSYQNVPELLVDWNLNVTRCKLMVTGLPLVSSSPDLIYSNTSLPLLVGDLAQICHIVLLPQHITDTELIHTLCSSDLYAEHQLDAIRKKHLPPPITAAEQSYLTFRYKEIATRNYLVNLAAAATTAYEYKLRSDAVKRDLKRQANGERKKLTKEEKKTLWDSVRMDVFRRAGLEE
ncbi:hypothetical protein HF325_002941 [Metschnikowia pulcherrima]|uniref:Uncharacterized protein n=1 Tax=Metschnikowia pulcherrima TaxID=27326 RepID=A0A8H7L9P6_9ASCO|nr:hypothetical protein HF325_002941 [Metschnikowia pulcherrima]